MVMVDVFQCQPGLFLHMLEHIYKKIVIVISTVMLKWHTKFGHLNRGDMLTSEQHDVVLFCSVLFWQ